MEGKRREGNRRGLLLRGTRKGRKEEERGQTGREREFRPPPMS